MRSLAFLSLIVFVHGLDQALVDELIEKIQEVGMKCAEQENPPQEDIEALLRKEPPSSHEGKCTIFCVLKKFDIMRDNVTFGPGYVEWLDKAKADDGDFYKKMMDIYDFCGKKVKLQDDGCENAFQLALCTKEEGIKAGLEKTIEG